MAEMIIEKREIPVAGEVDVLVAGGGIAGIAAALSVRRQGQRVMLIEKSAVLGGLATLGLVNYYEPLCDGDGYTMTKGIAEELLKLSIKYGYDSLPEQWLDEGEPKANPSKRYSTLFNPAVFSLALNELLINEGIELRYDMIAAYPLMDGNKCKGVFVESKSGREVYLCNVLIDGTGDADMICRAGIPCRYGQNYLTYYGHGCNTESMKKALSERNMVKLNGKGFHIGSDLEGNGHPEGMHYFTGVTNEEVSEYIITGQRMLLEKLKKASKEEQCLYTLPGMAQLRKTRCIIGDETFTGEDGKHVANSIGAVGDFRVRHRHYEIPLGTLYNKDYPNILAAGRVISAMDDGWEISRVIPTAALTGEAAGIVAFLANSKGIPVSQVRTEEVQEILVSNGVKIHF